MQTRGIPFENPVGLPIMPKGKPTSFARWYYDLQNLYISNFRWEGIGYPVDMSVVERYLLERGSVAFFIDELMGPQILPYVREGTIDPYGNPYSIRAYGINGYQRTLMYGQFVIIWDNLGKTIRDLDLRMYAERLALIDRVQDININAQKTPFLITAETEAQMNSLMLAYKKYNEGDPVIAQIGSVVSSGMNVFSTGAPIVYESLQNQKLNLLSEALTLIGVPNIGQPKRERMITNEVSAINGHVVHERSDRLIPRLQAVEMINAMFGEYGMNLSVDFANQNYNIGLSDMEVATPERG